MKIGEGIDKERLYNYVRILSNSGVISFDAIGANYRNRVLDNFTFFSETINADRIPSNLEIDIPTLHYGQSLNEILNVDRWK